MNQREFARKADISLTYAGEIERGEKMPSLEVVVRIAASFGLSAARLLTKAKL